MNEQRFALSYRESADDSGDAPGLVLGDDGNVYVIDQSGTRSMIGPSTPAKLDPFTTVSAGAVVLNAGSDSLTLESGEGTTGVLIQSTGTGPVKISSGSGGIDIGEFSDAFYFKMLSSGIDVHSANDLTLHGDGDVQIQTANGAKLTVGQGSLGGNGGLAVAIPGNGSTPTLDINLASGTVQITGTGAGILTLNAGDVKLQGSGHTGIDVSSGGGHPVVQVCGDAAGFLGFFGKTAANQIAGSTLTTVAQVVAALQTYGLFS